MGEREKEVQWLKAGHRRLAVAKALYKPMTGTQIRERARESAPKMHLRDVSFVLRELKEKELACCLTPDLPKGRIYFLTPKGRSTLANVFNETGESEPGGIDWPRYAHVVRAPIRRLVMEELARPCWNGKQGKTASELRKMLLARHPISLWPVRRAIAALLRLRLVRRVRSDTKELKRYVLTPMGSRMLSEMNR